MLACEEDEESQAPSEHIKGVRMEFYYDPTSDCSRRVLCFAGVHAIALNTFAVDQRAGEHRLPTLVDGDFVLWESAAILRYLAQAHAPETLGHSPQSQALIDQWMFWGVASLQPFLEMLRIEVRLMFAEDLDPVPVNRLKARINASLNMLIPTLQASLFIGGLAPTLADFVIAPSLEAIQRPCFMKFEEPLVAQWLERMTSLPGWPPVS